MNLNIKRELTIVFGNTQIDVNVKLMEWGRTSNIPYEVGMGNS